MLQKIINFILGRKPSVDGAIGVFSKALADLEKIEQRHKDEAQAHADLAQRALSKADGHAQEADRARAIFSKIDAIVSHHELDAVPSL